MRIALSKIAVAKDNSYAKLLELLYAGYDRVQWCLSSQESCELCQAISQSINSAGGMDLAHFLGYSKEYIYVTDDAGRTVPKLDDAGKPEFNLNKEVEIYKDAPIYNWSHCGCTCFLLIFKGTDTNDSIIVTKEG